MVWNRERVVFGLALLVCVASAIDASSSFFRRAGHSTVLVEPRPATEGAVGTGVEIHWYEGGEGPRRDPFRSKSQWGPAEPDPLSLPPHRPLLRRIPLPAAVAHTDRAWPLLEATPPETVEEDSP